MIRMEPFATVSDVKELWREMTEEETKRAEKLLGVVSDCLRVEADKVGKDLDAMIEQKPFLQSVAKSVTVDVVARTLMTSTDSGAVGAGVPVCTWILMVWYISCSWWRLVYQKVRVIETRIEKTKDGSDRAVWRR